MKIIFPYLFFLLFGLCSCEKPDDNPPIEPITAENTFSCEINGETFVPENHGGFYPQLGILVSVLEENSWKIILSNDKITLYFFIKRIKNTGKYPIHESDGDNFFTFNEESSIEYRNRVTNEIFSSSNDSNQIEVLSFQENEELVFQFNKIVLESTSNLGKTITLTEGKLNINKTTLNRD